MLIVMMILLVATTLAGVSLQATQYELRAAGFARSAMQTQYVSEAAMMSTMAWLDVTSANRSLLTFKTEWNVRTNRQGPSLTQFGEPALGTAGENAMRGEWIRQSDLMPFTIPPLTLPDESNDPIGSFGPRVATRPGAQDPDRPDQPTSYVVDMYDCHDLEGSGSVAETVNDRGSGTITAKPMYCVVTSRGRSYEPGGGDRKWTSPGGGTYTLNRFTLAHDMRGTVVTPPIVRSN